MHRKLIADALGRVTCKKEGTLDLTEGNEVSAEDSANPYRNYGTRVALQSCSKLRQDAGVLHQPVIGCGLPSGRARQFPVPKGNDQ